MDDPRSGKVVRSRPTDTLSTLSPTLSADGRILYATDDGTRLLGKVIPAVVSHVRVLDSTTLHPNAVLDVGRLRNATAVSEETGRPGQILVRVTPLVPVPVPGRADDYAYGDTIWEVWDWPRQRLLGRLMPRFPEDVTYGLPAPDGSEICCVAPDQYDHVVGRLHFCDPRTGAQVREIDGSTARPVDGPAFYLPDGRLVSKDTLYDAHGTTGRPLLPDHPGRRCVSGEPGVTGRAFFQSATGLELWDVSRQALVRQWPGVRDAAAVFVSPDRSTLAVVSARGAATVGLGSGVHVTDIQFWTYAVPSEAARTGSGAAAGEFSGSVRARRLS